MSARVFTCSLDNAKRSFYCAFNSLFRKIGRIASEDVIVQLVKTKCLPVLYYCLEACPLKKSQLSAVDFALMVDGCKQIFSCQTPSDAVADRKCKFLKKFIVSITCFAKCLRTWQWTNWHSLLVMLIRPTSAVC